MSRSNKLGVKTMNKTLTTHRQRDWKEYNNALKKRASLDFWLVDLLRYLSVAGSVESH
jgi:hypothetical protein